MKVNEFEVEHILDLNKVRYQDKRLLPQAACIYFVVSQTSVLYIGKAENLNKRWISHHKHLAISVISDVCIYYLQVAPSNLSDYEGQLIRKFKPLLNEKIPQDPQKKVEPLKKENPNIGKSIRFPNQLRLMLESVAKERGISLSEVVVETCEAQYNSHSLASRVTKLEQQVQSIESQLEADRDYGIEQKYR